jgi:hypothetical protein
MDFKSITHQFDIGQRVARAGRSIDHDEFASLGHFTKNGCGEFARRQLSRIDLLGGDQAMFDSFFDPKSR